MRWDGLIFRVRLLFYFKYLMTFIRLLTLWILSKIYILAERNHLIAIWKWYKSQSHSKRVMSGFALDFSSISIIIKSNFVSIIYHSILVFTKKQKRAREKRRKSANLIELKNTEKRKNSKKDRNEIDVH